MSTSSEQVTPSGPSPLERAAPAGTQQFLTFKLSKEQYGIDIQRVTEIIGVVDITRVPRCPPHVLGVINLRGKIIPLLDLRLRFGMEPVPYDDKTCIIVTSVKTKESRMLVGTVVDTVLEVVNIAPNKILPPPEYGLTVDTSSVIGMGKLSGTDVAILLDIDKTLDISEDLPM